MFKQLQQTIQKRFDQLAQGETVLFNKQVDRDIAWLTYLDGFPKELEQEHNCNCCKSFIRQFSGIVFIKNNKVESIWNINVMEVDEEYRNSIISLQNYIATLPISDVFLPEDNTLGTPSNPVFANPSIIWNHFALTHNFATTASANVASRQGEFRNNKNVFKRALDELKVPAINTVIELIDQGSLYRSVEKEKLIRAFYAVKTQYDNLQESEKEAFAWKFSVANPWICGMRNDVIGTFIVDLSEGVDLDTAVRKYESKVAPANYKRTTAAVTPKMIEEAKKTIGELGYMDSLERRYATATDISIENLIFADRSSQLTDVFGELAKDAPVNPKTLTKVEEVTIKDFLEKIVPTAKEIELLVENSHLPNLVSLITSVDPDAKSLFKWNNPFSWSYAGGVTDSIKERVKAAGGSVTGVLRFSIQWNDEDTKGNLDFDAHAHEPNNTHIYYGSGFRGQGASAKYTPMSGNLDVDMMGGSSVQIENITWQDINRMKDGVYKFKIHNYSGRTNNGFKAQIEFNGEVYDFHYPKSAMGYIDVADVILTKGIFTINPKLPANSSVISKLQWGIKTNQFTKVKSIMLSPNHWNADSGNKHFMFILDGCVSDEEPRPFYQEFLNSELHDNRRVFEILAGKLKVQPSLNQLSGVGFSDTQRNTIIARVTGAFKRNIKIKI